MIEDTPKSILSLGLGVQSTALYLQSSIGILPRYDAAIFVDLGREKTGTYKYLSWLLSWQEANSGVPITVVKRKNLFTDLMKQSNSTANRLASIPAYTKNDDGSIGMLKRQCTNEYKIAQVDNHIRLHFYESKRYARLPLTKIIKGISFDEVDRMNIPMEAWKMHVYPFCGWETYRPGKARQIESKKQTRAQIISWYVLMGLPIPPKSSCVFCPYRSEFSWKDLKEHDPDDFEAACLVDEAIRDSSRRGITQPIFLHESCVPLRDVIFKEDAPDLWSGDCSGTCHN